MTDHDWDHEVWPVLAGCFPRVTAKLTPEEQASYRRVLDRYTTSQAIVAIRTWKDTKTAYLTPAGLDALVRAQVHENRDRTESDDLGISYQGSIRRRWAAEQPQRADELLSLTDTEVDIRCRHWDWLKYHELFGPDYPATKAFWKQWQLEIYYAGQRDIAGYHHPILFEHFHDKRIKVIHSTLDQEYETFAQQFRPKREANVA